MESCKIDKFIEFVIDLVNEDPVFSERQVNSQYYFMHGGCYELYKIVKHYFPQVKCMIEINLDHCAIEYEEKIYDATGIRLDVENFVFATEEDMEYMDRSFGLNITNLEAPKVIEDIEQCDIKKFLY